MGLRTQALEALRDAVRQWPDNAIYREVLEGIENRYPQTGVIELQSAGTITCYTYRWPLIIGRGEEAALRLSSPMVSRAHAEIALLGDQPYARAISDKGGLRYRGEDQQPAALTGHGVLEIAGVPIDCEVSEVSVKLQPVHEEGRSCIGLLKPDWLHDGIQLRRDEEDRIVIRQQPNVTLNGDAVHQDTPLLIDDEIVHNHSRYKVVGPRSHHPR